MGGGKLPINRKTQSFYPVEIKRIQQVKAFQSRRKGHTFNLTHWTGESGSRKHAGGNFYFLIDQLWIMQCPMLK